MSTAKHEVKFSMKVMINKEKAKVLFAEVNSDFTDVLLSFMTLPLGKILRILEKHCGDEAVPVIGSLNSLRKGLANLDDVHFCTKASKLMLLNPINPYEDECGKLKLNIDHDAPPTKYFTCEDWNCTLRRSEIVCMNYDTRTCYCGKLMNREIGLHESGTEAAANTDDGVFTINKISFLISDDLRMVPNVTGSIIQTLQNLGISDMNGAELRTVTVGFNEIMGLLRRSLLSETPLTDFILHKRQMNYSPTAKSEPGIQMEKNTTPNTKKMIVKVMIQKSRNKLLFAQAEEDFVDFLFSFLTIPLGSVECLLNSKTCLGSIDNLYRSIANINGDKFLKSLDTKKRLLKPELPPKFLSKNQIFSLTEQSDPILYFSLNKEQSTEYLSNSRSSSSVWARFKDPKGEGSYVKGPRMFMVSDDLTVMPLCVLSSLSILNELKIPLSDVKEVELQIGLEEGLSILRASLTSTSALTNGLMINQILKKQPKEEH